MTPKAERISRRFCNTSGFSLIEIIIAIVIIGIAVPTIVVPFSSVKDMRTPEVMSRAAYLGQRQLEGIVKESLGRIPAAGTYACAAFVPATPPTPAFDIDCTADAEFTFTWEVQGASALSPDSGSGSFGKKIKLTVTPLDTTVSPLEFYALF